MNYIFAIHPGQIRSYAFYVPDELVCHLKVGTPILVETRKGRSIAICQTSPFSGDGAADVVKMHGAYDPIRPVIGIIDNAVREYVAREIVKNGQITVDSFTICVKEVPHESR